MNWKEKLQSLGLQESDLSVRIKKIVKDYHEIEAGYNEAQNDLEGGNLSDEDEKEAKQTLDELSEALENLNKTLIYEVEKFHKNKDVYAAKSQNLKNGKAKSQSKQSAPQPPVAGVSVQTPSPVVAQGEAVPEKKGGIGKWVLFLALAVITGGVVLNNMNSDE